jgi:hypothetical protein
MDTLKYKLLSYIHHSDSYFAKKIRNYLPISWKDILCDYELNDLNTALLMTTKKHEAEYESESDEGGGLGMVVDAGAGVGVGTGAGVVAGAGVSEEEASFFSLEYLWEKGCPDKI